VLTRRQSTQIRLSLTPRAAIHIFGVTEARLHLLRNRIETVLSTGVAIGGRKLGLMTEMAQSGLRYLRDDEIAELHAYLSAPEAAAHP
jgi:hypothetical protein